MKKETVFRKIVFHSLLGFPVGITLLMINYASVYLIAGENTFTTEIAQLQNITTLVLQLIVIGFAYYLFFINIHIIVHLKETKSSSNKFLIEHPYKAILNMLLVVVITFFIMTLLDFKVFTDNIVIMNIISFMIVLTLSSIYVCIKATIESNLVKKINQKLKERNKHT